MAELTGDLAANCSKCGKDLDTAGYPLWCKACRAAYQREQEQTRKQKGYKAGIEAMREYLCRNFGGRYAGTEVFMASDVTRIIATVPGPPAD